MADELRDVKIAILATDGVEQVELEQPREVLERAGGHTELLSLDDGEIQAMNSDLEPADTFPVERSRNPGDLDAFCDAIVREFSAVRAS